MKIALVCDDLTQHGGHENVILEFCKIFPNAPLYTTFATKEWSEECEKKNIKLVTSKMQWVPFKKKINRFIAPFMCHVIALEQFNFDNYDLVISLSSRFAHGVITKPQTLHICYMSTVGRMIWEPDSYFKNDTFSNIKILNKIKMAFLRPILGYMRIWDKMASSRPDYFICNARTTQARIKKYYGRESTIINPPVVVEDFTVETERVPESYYLVLTRLAAWKRVDLAIKACKELESHLKIIGDGPDAQRLKVIAGDSKNIEFLGYLSDKEKVKYLKSCKAVINTQYEDFGIVPLEAMASGKPVIAYGKGGVLETIVNQKTGEFFEEQSVESLKDTLKRFDAEKYSSEVCVSRAREFDTSIFKKKVKEKILVYTKEYK